MSILMVEDNVHLIASLTRGFAELDMTIVAVRTGGEALLAMQRRECEAVILDLGLPDIDGLDVLDAAREAKLMVPILVLSARDAVHHRILAFDRGADDFLVKPFVFAELVARVRALLRRVPWQSTVALRIGDLQVDPELPNVRVGLRSVALSRREHALLQHLVRNARRVVSRSEIWRAVFGHDSAPQTNLIDVHVAHLRRKLIASSVRIETIRGKGYRVELPSSLDGVSHG